MQNLCIYRKTGEFMYLPGPLVPGVDQFSNSNIHVLDQLILQTKTDLKSLTTHLLSTI